MINLTPHVITLYKEGGERITLESSGVARATQTEKKIGEIDGFPVYKLHYGEVQGLPDAKDNIIYIVSILTAQAIPDREDVYVITRPQRDGTGRIVGAHALAHI